MNATNSKRADLFAGGSVTVAGLKAKYGIGRSKAYEMMEQGSSPFSMVYGRRLIPCKAVEELLASGLAEATSEAGSPRPRHHQQAIREMNQ